MNNVTIHIGMPKTSSTTLQKMFFQNLPNINYIDHYLKTNPLYFSLFSIFQEEEYSFNLRKIRSNFDSVWNKKLSSIISCEIPCYSPSVLSDIYILDRFIIAKRFKQLFPNARILLIIRNQLDLYKSLYAERYNSKTMNMFFNEWLNYNIDVDRKFSNIFNLGDYKTIIEIYKELFEFVHILVFEKMVLNYRKSIEDEICSFIGLPKDSSSFFIDNKLNTMSSKGIDNLVYSAEQIEYLKNRYCLGNKYISRKYNLELESYNYFV